MEFDVDRHIVATRPQGCALSCGARILEGERIVSLRGRGWAHARDVIPISSNRVAVRSDGLRSDLSPPRQEIRRGTQKQLLAWLLNHPNHWTGAMYVPAAGRNEKYVWWEPRG